MSSPAETASANALLDVDDLKVHFPIHSGLFKRVTGHVRAVDGVTLCIPRGQTLALVGESGCFLERGKGSPADRGYGVVVKNKKFR